VGRVDEVNEPPWRSGGLYFEVGDVLRFRTSNKRPVPNYLGSHEQRRLLVLVMLLGLAMIAARQAGDPRLWRWLFAGQAASGDARDKAGVLGVARGEIDTRLRKSTATADPPDVVVIQAPIEVGGTSGKRLMHGIRPEWLTAVRDDTVLRGGAEHEALYSLLKLLNESDESTLARASRGPASYLQLFKQPAEYRGELVALRGTVVQAGYRQAAKNEQGVDGFYKLVISPDDHRSGLIFVYCLELPQGFPAGDGISCDVELIGLFYKRWAYSAQDGIRTAPLLLAKSVTWTNPPGSAPDSAINWPGIATSVVIAGVVCLMVVLWVNRRPAPTAASLRGKIGPKDVASHLAGLEASMTEISAPLVSSEVLVEEPLNGPAVQRKES
jgi:hypothetical protein